jgi:Domain of unknown function (DUF4159)/A-macroglobulin TED domain
MSRGASRWFVGCSALIVAMVLASSAAAGVTREEVERAIQEGVRYLKKEQRDDGSWTEVDGRRAPKGTTALVTLALLTAGEKPDEIHVAKALAHLQESSAPDLNSTYSVALQTMVFTAADPQLKRYRLAVTGNVLWLEKAQIKNNDRNQWPGSWSYNVFKEQSGDNSNTQYALLGLNAAAEAGLPVRSEVWTLARHYWEDAQRLEGSWSYNPGDNGMATASMTCAGISSLVITGMKRYEGQESLVGDQIRNCGRGGINPNLQRGVDWLTSHFFVGQNFPRGQLWKYYYLYGLERAGRLTGLRFLGDHDWYREGAEYLVHKQDRVLGFWSGAEVVEPTPHIATSFALLFLAKGRAPVLINKLRHGPGNDWNNDRDDVRNLVGLVSKDWGPLLTWQTVDPSSASVEDLMQAPIVFFNGHEIPRFDANGKKNLREYIEQGGFIFAEACCSRPEFDMGFRALMKEIFPEPEYELHPLAEDHPVWRAKWRLTPDVHPLWGIEHGCRTVVIYTPSDLSCYWNQMEAQPENTSVVKANHVGQNVVDYVTGRELPADKLEVRTTTKFVAEGAKRGALHIAKLKHAGDWNIAPLAIPNLTTLLKDKLQFDVVINHREILPRDPNLKNYPLLYIHGRAALAFDTEDLAILRRHLEPGGGTIFADAACGSPSFDVAFRRFAKELLPDNPLVPIPRDDEIYTKKIGYDLSDVQYTKAAGGGKDFPLLEGVKLNGHWAVIYSKYDLGCALERAQGQALDCKGYNHESALRIAANIVISATLP